MNITVPDDTDLGELRRHAARIIEYPDGYAEASLKLAKALVSTTVTGFRLEVVPGTNPDRLVLKHPDGQTVKYYNRSLLESRGHTNLPPAPAPDITVTIPANATDAQILAAVREVLG